MGGFRTSALQRLGRMAGVFGAAFLVMGSMGACDGGEADVTVPEVTPPSTEWSQTMTTPELLVVVEAVGESVSPEAKRSDIIGVLESVIGCGCFGATCGIGLCGHECGTCTAEGDAFSCFSGSCVAEYTCPETSATLSAGAGIFRETGEAFTMRFAAEVTGNDAFDTVRIQSNGAVATALGPGTYDLRHFDPSACELCVRAYKDCAESGECGTSMVASSGMVTLDTAIGGDIFVGSVTDLKFEESYEDPKTKNVYVLPNNKNKRCVASFTFSGAVEKKVITPSDCNKEGTGNTIGSAVGEMVFQNCLGDEVKLHTACGQEAVWTMAVAGWCGACPAHLAEVAKLYEQKKIEGLEVLAVLGEDASGAPPTLDYCKSFADKTGFPPERMVIDASWDVLFKGMNSGGSGGIGLPWDGILDGQGLIYVFNSEQGEGSAHDVVTGLLEN